MSILKCYWSSFRIFQRQQHAEPNVEWRKSFRVTVRVRVDSEQGWRPTGIRVEFIWNIEFNVLMLLVVSKTLVLRTDCIYVKEFPPQFAIKHACSRIGRDRRRRSCRTTGRGRRRRACRTNGRERRRRACSTTGRERRRRITDAGFSQAAANVWRPANWPRFSSSSCKQEVEMLTHHEFLTISACKPRVYHESVGITFWVAR